ncbi:hypothetical protein [Microcoleus anatoxicus]|uniref:Uncharacterized protein n=1 Tax=Microcoleus anatoxicus PTRS2 TaxID=2705321 RepID=A0ABU8YU05_9CYAN
MGDGFELSLFRNLVLFATFYTQHPREPGWDDRQMGKQSIQELRSP